MGQKQKTDRKRKKRERKLIITMAKLRMAHASRLGLKSAFWVSPEWAKSNGQRKKEERVKVSVINGQLRLQISQWVEHANRLDQLSPHSSKAILN